MRGHDRPSEGLRPLWRVEPDLERDRDSRQHATQHKYLDHRHCPWPCGLDERELMTECPANRPGAVTKVTGGRCVSPLRSSLNASTDHGSGKRRVGIRSEISYPSQCPTLALAELDGATTRPRLRLGPFVLRGTVRAAESGGQAISDFNQCLEFQMR